MTDIFGKIIAYKEDSQNTPPELILKFSRVLRGGGESLFKGEVVNICSNMIF